MKMRCFTKNCNDHFCLFVFFCNFYIIDNNDEGQEQIMRKTFNIQYLSLCMALYLVHETSVLSRDYKSLLNISYPVHVVVVVDYFISLLQHVTIKQQYYYCYQEI